MAKIPPFFIPHADSPEQAEKIYGDLAKASHQLILPVAERIYSITYKHDGEEWTATVGEQLRGTKYHVTGKGINKREIEVPTSDPATVLAIFPGIPYRVATTQVYMNVGSRWESIFMAGNPYSIIRFAPQED